MEQVDSPTATVIGSGPNGLSASLVLAAAGIPTTEFVKKRRIGTATCGRERPTACFAFDGVNFTRRSSTPRRVSSRRVSSHLQ